MTTPEQRRDAYLAAVGGNVGGHVLTGSNITVTTIHQAAPGPAAVVGVPMRLERRPEQIVGRDDLLSEVRARLHGGSGVTVVALSGLGGVGKTTTAVEYSHRHHGDYTLIWHMRAETVTGLQADFHDLAQALGADPGADPVEAVHTMLAGRTEPWLLVLDNVTDHTAGRRFLPSHGPGHVLVTTQDGTWPHAQRLDVPTLSAPAATAFLLDAAATTDATTATQVAAALGLLPLALTQAAAYLRASGMSLTEYLGLLQRQPVPLLTRGAPAAHGPLSATWSLALADLAATSPASITLLRLLAFAAPEDIPFRLLLEQPAPTTDVDPQIGADIEALRDGPFALPDAMAGLRRHSLVGPPSHTVTVHRLVQTITRHALTAAEQQEWQTATAALIAAAVPDDVSGRDAWPVCALLLPHALAACDLTGATVWNLAGFLGHAGDYTAARTVWATIADAHTNAPDFGPEHPDTLGARSNLARWTGESGDTAAALDQLQILLRERERLLGPEHPDTLTARDSLARWTGNTGDVAGARDMYRALVPDRERVSGHDHPDTLTARDNLAHWTARAGDAAGARDLFRVLLPERERVSGPDHPDTLTARANLAAWTGEAGDAAAARDLFRALLPQREWVLGPEHPDTLTTSENLAAWTGEAGDPATARDLYRALVPVRERVLGPEHPDTMTARSNFAYWTGAAGDPATARDLFRVLVPVRERVLGPEHPDTVATHDNLTYWTQRAAD